METPRPSHIFQLFLLSIILYGSSITLLGAGLLMCITLPLASIHDAATSVYLITSMSVIFLGIGATLPNCLSLALVHYKHAYGKAGALLGLIYYVQIFLFIAVMNIIHNGTFLPMPIYCRIDGLPRNPYCTTRSTTSTYSVN